MSATMQAVIWEGPDQVEEREVPVPVPGDGETLIKVAFDGICGTDLAILHGKHPRAQAPLIPGHEISGWAASGPDKGRMVVVEPLIECGTCGPCRHSYGYVCDHLGLYGIDAPGGMAEYVVVPTDTVHVIPEGVAIEQAAIVEPLAVAVHAVRLSEIRPGDVAAVFGAGPIGTLTALVARARGAAHIGLVEPNQWRADAARGLGFGVFDGIDALSEDLRAHHDGELADLVFDAAGHPAVSPVLTEAVRVRGRIVIVAVYKAPSAIDLRDVCFKELDIRGVRVYSREDFAEAINLIASGKLDLAGFTTKAFGFAEASEAFTAATAGDGQFKVLLRPDRS